MTEETRLRVAMVDEYEELKAMDFLLKRWKMDKKNHLMPKIEEVNEIAKKLEDRWEMVMEEFDKFFKKEQLVPKDASFYYFVEDGAIYAAPRFINTPLVVLRSE